MNAINPDKNFWSARYNENETGWDFGTITTPLKNYIDQIKDQSISILIPGAGNSHEAEYLFKNGFKNCTVLDIAEEPLQNIQNRIPDFPLEQLICGDFFEHKGNYDLILEQTFFCALYPSLRKLYAEKMSELLKQGGKLVGVLFNDKMNDNEPPFGGSADEYRNYFSPYFNFNVFEACYNSIEKRSGRELFIVLEKK
ncbi:SAM-dependent methyltransferase [Bacteroidota bacterium]|nr:SAM-dependent methyltransferase [Bacteroidota bacterium]